jgi:hypothetical protein
MPTISVIEPYLINVARKGFQMLKKTEVSVFRVERHCEDEECKGMMNRDIEQDAILSLPPKFPHKCTMCGAKEYYFQEYPHTEFKDKV